MNLDEKKRIEKIITKKATEARDNLNALDFDKEIPEKVQKIFEKWNKARLEMHNLEKKICDLSFRIDNRYHHPEHSPERKYLEFNYDHPGEIS